MNDRFNFRGQTENGKWIYGSLLWYAGDPQIWDKEGNNFIVKSETVGQCTGLKDKNGKLIFEGDIIKTSPSGYFDKGTDIFYVKYCCTGFFLATPYRHMEGDWECSDTIGTYDSNLYECIGNIYMNSELLEVNNEHT